MAAPGGDEVVSLCRLRRHVENFVRVGRSRLGFRICLFMFVCPDVLV